MKIDLRNNKDFWAGIMFLATGAAAMFLARDYRFGSVLNMGPGFFPMALAGILILIGLYVLLTGLRRNEKVQGGWSLRALIVMPLSLILFGVLMDKAGFIPALLVLIFGAAFACRESKLKEVLSAAAFLVLLSVGVFIWGLDLPFPLFKGF